MEKYISQSVYVTFVRLLFCINKKDHNYLRIIVSPHELKKELIGIRANTRESSESAASVAFLSAHPASMHRIIIIKLPQNASLSSRFHPDTASIFQAFKQENI